jgi:hypothetical protein
MTHMEKKRPLRPAPSVSSSLSKKKRADTTNKSNDQGDFLPRFGYREYPDFVHQRARAERDRKLGKTTVTISDDEFERRLSRPPAHVIVARQGHRTLNRVPT